MKKSILSILTILSLTVFSEKLSAQAPPCDFSFENWIDCPLNISIEIVCGSNTYCYSGSVGAGTFNSPTTANINFNALCGPPPTANPCNFKGCTVNITINGQLYSHIWGDSFVYCCNPPNVCAGVPNACMTIQLGLGSGGGTITTNPC